MLGVEQLDASLPLLERLPWPVLRLTRGYSVLWANEHARRVFGRCEGLCHVLTHGSDRPCDSGACPIALLEKEDTATVMHAHNSATGVSFFRITALAVADGTVVELQVPLGEDVTRDALTGLFTRTFFAQLVSRQVSLLHRIDCGYSVLVIDVDNLKNLNDAHSHQTGDAALRAVARVLLHETRQGDLQCRWGGDEMVVFAPTTNTMSAGTMAARILSGVRTIELADGLRLSASIGVAAASKESFDDTLRRADLALYKAKALGRDRVVIEGTP